jgi:uncharacterized protein (DUF1697 family)
MPRYAAFLRGVSPMNARMPELKRAFEAAGFDDVKTLLSSGNVVFSASSRANGVVERRAEAAMNEALGRSFLPIVRRVDALSALLASEPFAAFKLEPGTKRVITFLRAEPTRALRLPIVMDDARILRVKGCEVFSVYVPGPKAPVFMTLLEKTFGKQITTRTWETVSKATRA